MGYTFTLGLSLSVFFAKYIMHSLHTDTAPLQEQTDLSFFLELPTMLVSWVDVLNRMNNFFSS